MKQLRLFKEKSKRTYGGAEIKGKRKTLRPLDSKKPLHLILKAQNSDHLLQNESTIRATYNKHCARFAIKSYQLIVNADHIHLVLSVPNRDLYKRWIRALTGVLARKIKGLTWEEIPYSRVANWGKDFANLKTYAQDNQLEADFVREMNRRVEEWRQEMSGWLTQMSV